jgi:hypothetical protein
MEAAEWRADLRRFLAERVGQDLSAADLFDKFGAEMPLHHATRIFMMRRKGLGITPHEKMRWEAFSATLRVMNVRFEPRLSHTSRLIRATRVIPQTIACKGCGRPFFSYLDTRTCSRKCSIRLWRRIKAEASPAPIAPPTPVIEPIKRGDPRHHRYTIKLTEAEFQATMTEAKRRHLRVSDVVREALLDHLTQPASRQAAE